MASKFPSWYKPKKQQLRKRNYLAIEKFKRGGKQYAGVFKRQAIQQYSGKEWVTIETKRRGIKAYSPVRKFKAIAASVGMGQKAKTEIRNGKKITLQTWSFVDMSEKSAGAIVKKGTIQLLRVRVEGLHGGKRRAFTSYVRFSPNGRAFKDKKGAAQKQEHLQKLIARVALAKIRSLGYSSSPESKRNLDEGDSKKNERFFVQSIRVDSVQ